MNNTGSRTLTRFESSSEAHTAAGVLFGTGILFREVGSRQVTSITMNYSITKYSGGFFKRSGDLYVGGLTMEIGFRFMASDFLNRFRKKPQDQSNLRFSIE